MSLLHVRQIETGLREAYASDHWQENLSDEANLSRLLARRALDLVLGDRTGDGATLIELTDGGKDKGIDAVGVDPLTKRVVLVQSKWRKDGTGSIDLAGVLKFVDGVRSLLDIESTGIPTCSDVAKSAIRTVMQAPGGTLRLVLATTASNDLSDEVRAPLTSLMEVLNDGVEGQSIADYTVLTQSHFYEALAQPSVEAVDLDVQILDWGRNPDPAPSYYGRVSTAEVAGWFEKHGSGLFAENIRVVLPQSEINEGIMRTIRDEPQLFWYYNNGITVLAAKIDTSLAGAAARDARFLQLKNASVVNGAQTVSTLGRALKDGQLENLQNAYVSIRIIEISDANDDLARRVTRFANTQNVVSSQDFVFLDPEQHRLVKELRVSGYEYILRSGEQPTSKQADKVIDVRQAAVALACGTEDIGNAVLAKREVSRLFDRESGPYKQMFNGSVNGLVVARCVEVVRALDRVLDQEAEGAEGVRAGVAVHGRRIIAHVVLNELGRKSLGDPDYDFDSHLASVPDRALELLDQLSMRFPDNSYPGNVFKNQSRCVELLRPA